MVGRRITTPIFGNGLIEAIPHSAILASQDPGDANQDGISGRANILFNPETRTKEVGRFGWKCQVSSVHLFAGDAYRNEMGITSPSFPTEVLPQGRAIPPGADLVADPEDVNGNAVARLTDFMRFTAAPAPLNAGSPEARALFASTGCASCHTPTMTTGANAVAALANKQVNLYSDLLLHDMGSQLADGIRQGLASGTEFRTAPLWGVRFRRILLHDGRAQTVDQAVRLHGGEATNSISRYIGLTPANRTTLLNFVQGL
ncbi:MAG: di-heme oxidoredictase family protein [Fimbriimonadaceae bacterium]